ncbi:MAG: hypothetical protein WCO72_13280, partial [Betaproteobacteria bacterium]
ITRGMSREPMIAWLREKWGMKLVEEFAPKILAQMTKVIVNGCWIGSVDSPTECIEKFRLYKRNALIPIYSSATFDIQSNTIFVYTDAGRLCRPIFYRDEATGRASYQSKKVLKMLQDGEFSWTDLISGFNKKRATIKFDPSQMKIYELFELYEGVETETNPAKLERFLTDKAVLDYIDTSESENAYIALNADYFEMGRIDQDSGSGHIEDNSASPSSNSSTVSTALTKSTKHTHCEIHNSLILGMMCNMIIFPENNPAAILAFIAALLTMMLGSIPQQDVFQRVTSSKTVGIAQSAAILGGLLYFAFAFVPMYLVYSGTLIDPEMVSSLLETDSQLILPQLILKHTPLFAQIMFFGALLSALKSCASATLLAPSVSFSENIIKDFFDHPSPKKMLSIMRITVVVFAVIVTVVAMNSQLSIFKMVENAYKVTLVGAFIPLVFGIYWKRANPIGGLLSLTFGIVSWLLAELVLPGFIVPAQLLGLLASLAGMLIGGFLIPQEFLKKGLARRIDQQ